MGCGSSAEAADKKLDDKKKQDEETKKQDEKVAPAKAQVAEAKVADEAAQEQKKEEEAPAQQQQEVVQEQQQAPAEPEKPKIDWAAVTAKLPYERTMEQKKERFALFGSMDNNNSGKISLAEVLVGLKGHICPPLSNEFDLDSVIHAAFNVAKQAGVKAGKPGADGDFVERLEFRLLLLYTREYFELYQLFDELDKSGDNRVSIEEFKKSIPLMTKWGVTIADDQVEETFKSIDTSDAGAGSITFQEFAKWAMAQNLDSPDDDDNIDG